MIAWRKDGTTARGKEAGNNAAKTGGWSHFLQSVVRGAILASSPAQQSHVAVIAVCSNTQRGPESGQITLQRVQSSRPLRRRRHAGEACSGIAGAKQD